MIRPIIGIILGLGLISIASVGERQQRQTKLFDTTLFFIDPYRVPTRDGELAEVDDTTNPTFIRWGCTTYGGPCDHVQHRI